MKYNLTRDTDSRSNYLESDNKTRYMAGLDLAADHW